MKTVTICLVKCLWKLIKPLLMKSCKYTLDMKEYLNSNNLLTQTIILMVDA